MADKSETINNTFNQLIKIANQFEPDAQITDIRQHGSGNINNTFLVIVGHQRPFILQRLNTAVFCQPELVMDNICVLSDYVSQRLQQFELPQNRRWLIPQVLFTKKKQHHHLTKDGSFWRAISFIDNSQSFDTIQDLNHAQEIGYGLGMFHGLLNNLPPKQLVDTLEGFHITPGYLKHYQQVIKSIKVPTSPEINYCLQFISDRPNLPHILENAKALGKI
ncbi:MAG: aminoglycoside phosphotransferase, partial [Waterburya sp.]